MSAIALDGLIFFSSEHWPTNTPAVSVDRPPARLLPSDEAATDAEIAFYRARVQRDAEDTRSQNGLAELYLRRVHNTGNEDFLPLALAAARASLEAVPPERNLGGLSALAHAEFANHDFADAREHALRLIALTPDKSEPYAILGDARLELGDYPGATEAFAQMERFGEKDFGSETRLARLALVQGKVAEAQKHFHAALSLLWELSAPPGQSVAWCYWQLGETAFSMGDDHVAERFYRDALTTAPDYFRALASMGRLRAARGDLTGAIDDYERAVRLVPVSDFMAALGDLYALIKRPKDAAVRYELVEQLGEHSRKVHNSPFNRNLASFYANHDIKTEQAYGMAQGEYAAGRHDVYGADTLAWTALKAGRLTEAQAAMQEALRLGTSDAKFFYHAAMIARAAGRTKDASDNFKRALALCPGFDPLQSDIARRALKDLEQ